MPGAAVRDQPSPATFPGTPRRPESLALARGRSLDLTAPRVMGVLNITHDSFSDGGRWIEPRAAVARGLEMLAEGADLLDLGAESTRPGGGVYGAGATEVPVDAELGRLLPVLRELRGATAAPLSVDTRKAAVARVALAEGADLINDVSALGDPEMATVVAEHGCGIVLMHSRGELGTMQRGIRFADLLREVAGELEQSVELAVRRGISRERIVIDPGIGFGKTAAQNLVLLRRLDALTRLGLPVLVGASRKSFIGEVSAAGPAERVPGSLAAAGWAALHGAAILRVHDVAASRQFLDLWQAIATAEADA
jgi:dihydropteroate synthase